MSYASKNTARKSKMRYGVYGAASGSDLPGWIGWVAGLVVGCIVLAAAVLSAGYWGIDAQATPPSEAMVPAIGGMMIEAPLDHAGVSSTVTLPVNTLVPEYRPGAIVVSRLPDMPIYADVGAESLLLHSYGSGAEFTILEPSGDHAAYPVPISGTNWIRVRAADGLVGWTPVDAVIPFP